MQTTMSFCLSPHLIWTGVWQGAFKQVDQTNLFWDIWIDPEAIFLCNYFLKGCPSWDWNYNCSQIFFKRCPSVMILFWSDGIECRNPICFPTVRSLLLSLSLPTQSCQNSKVVSSFLQGLNLGSSKILSRKIVHLIYTIKVGYI